MTKLIKDKNFFQITCEKKSISEIKSDNDETIGLQIEGYASTRDKFGPQATIHSGVLAKIFDIDVLVARDWPLAESDGKVSATAANNTLGSFAVLYKPAVQYGFGQPLEIEAYRVPEKGVDLIATFEFGFAIANSVASLGKTVAAGINVTV